MRAVGVLRWVAGVASCICLSMASASGAAGFPPVASLASPLGFSPASAAVNDIVGVEGSSTPKAPTTGVAHLTRPGDAILSGTLAGETLPDKRVYEKVTPSNNFDADVYVPRALFGQESELSNGVPAKFPFQVGLDGTAITYPADPTPSGFGRGGSGLGNQYLARRTPQGEWAQTLIQPAALPATYFQGFSNDLTVGILNSGTPGEPLLPRLAEEAPGDGYRVLYARSNDGGVYRPLFSSTPMRVPQTFGTPDTYTVGKHEPVPVFAGASEDFGSRLFEANDALLSGEAPLEKELRTDVRLEITQNENHNYLYDSGSDGHLNLIDISPDGRVVPDATFGAPPSEAGVSSSETENNNPPDFQGTISADGSRIYWTNLQSGILFVRLDSTSTLQVSAGPARYWDSAAGGRYAIYTEGGQLYRFDVDNRVREPLTGSGDGVLGVLGTSTDGEKIYAVAEGVLGSGEGSEGAKAIEKQPNLYLLRHGQEPTFIAPLSAADGESVEPFNTIASHEELFGDWQAGLAHRTAEVSPGGEAVVFMSNQALKTAAYPNGVPNPSNLDEVYVFEANTNQLSCVSCSASGEAPPTWIAGAAAFLPASWSDTYLTQWMADEGNRVFFDSAVPLVALDTNGKQDVYEWEREGTGSCDSGAGINGGCVYLLSSGSGGASSWFVGASTSGDDAFIVTRSQLVAEDGNDTFDLYDARIGGTRPVSSPACAGAGCQGLPAPPPTFATPPSATFEGIGNFEPPVPARPKTPEVPTRAQRLSNALKACARDKQPRKRGVCKARARRRYVLKHKTKKTNTTIGMR